MPSDPLSTCYLYRFCRLPRDVLSPPSTLNLNISAAARRFARSAGLQFPPRRDHLRAASATLRLPASAALRLPCGFCQQGYEYPAHVFPRLEARDTSSLPVRGVPVTVTGTSSSTVYAISRPRLYYWEALAVGAVLQVEGSSYYWEASDLRV